MPPVSIVIPTRRRPAYLEVALSSVAGQAAAAGAEILVVDDGGPSPEGRALAERFAARYEAHPAPLGLNAARNTGVERSSGELVIFLDDDISAAPGWLGALLRAVEEHPATDVFAGRITARLEGSPPRSCGREAPPITTLDLGERDTETPFAWGANMAIRRSALERVGPFDLSVAEGGDEQEWQERLAAVSPSARTLYVAGALVEHRRAGEDSRLRSLCRSARVRGRAARRFDSRRGRAPSLRSELLTLAGCVGHVVRRRCPAGLTMVAHSAGRLEAAVGERSGAQPPSRAHPGPDADDFLSGASGTVGGLGAIAREIGDEALDAVALAGGSRRRLARVAAEQPPRRRVLILGVWRAERASLTDAIRAELLSSRHEIELHTRSPGQAGKFENLDLLLAEHGAAGHDWLLVIDDDVRLPRGFLDSFLFLSERFSLALSQPAHRLNSHAAWAVTRRRARSAVRETSFVEIGPVTAFAAVTFPVLLPFPGLRMGWGLDTHWAALALANGWRMGVVDAVPIGHRTAPAGASYSRQDAVAEARAFLAGRPHVSAGEAERTLATHRRW
jgi:GT2 family glycosyltransferase